MESNENNIDEICSESCFRKKYKIAAFKFLQSTLVQYAKYKRSDYSEGFKKYFIFKSWSNFINFSNFKKLRKKNKLKKSNLNEEDFNEMLIGYLNEYKISLDQMHHKVNNITYRFYDTRRHTCKI
jgi:hypothetical protein